MGKISQYMKRGVKYVLKEHKQPVIKVDVVQKATSNMFQGKTYLVTGGTSGLGFSIAKKLIEEGAKVIITGRNKEKIIKAQSELGKNCENYIYDNSNLKGLDDFFNSIIKKYKQIDGIVNNAGISLHEWDFLIVDEKGYDSQFNINLKGSYFLTQKYIQWLIDNQKEGNVLFISSERGTMPGDLPYDLTKASINSLVKSLSYRFYKQGIRVNAIAPGVTSSEMTKVDRNGDMYMDNPSGRYFVPEEVAEVVMFLLSDYSKCISGEIIHTNAGNHIKRGY